MSESMWAAVGPDWYRDAVCANKDPDLFSPAVETPKGLEEVKSAFCDRCPVRERCLQFAIIHDGRGYWGGTLTSERLAMKRTRSRAKCPITACRAPEPVVVGRYQVCLRCGASWQAEKIPEDVPLPA